MTNYSKMGYCALHNNGNMTKTRNVKQKNCPNNLQQYGMAACMLPEREKSRLTAPHAAAH